MSDIEQRLREAMDGVTPGPWYQTGEPWFSSGDGVLAGSPDGNIAYLIADCDNFALPRDEYDGPFQLGDQDRDAAYIALCSPDNIGALLDERAADRATIASLRSKLEEAEGAQGWQPIETAPKDGTPVLAYRSPSTYGTRSPLVFVAWHDESQAWIWPDDTYDPYVRDSYDDAFNEGSEFADTSFSHWMPIPSQPALASLREADHA